VSTTKRRTPAVRPQSVVDQVTEELLKRVLEGELPPGQPVAIQDLSAMMGVSHVPVREALRRLESRGLVIFRRGHRPQIAPVDIEDFDSIFRIRRLLEADVAERSASLFTPEAIAEVQELADEFVNAMRRIGAPLSVPSLHTRLHFALLPGATIWDRQVLEQLWDASERYIQLYVTHEQRSEDAIEMIIAGHQRIIDAAGKATPAAFRKVVTRHIDESIDALRPVILEITSPSS
jgi:DNA-binding GntR family transcriptional regulator